MHEVTIISAAVALQSTAPHKTGSVLNRRRSWISALFAERLSGFAPLQQASSSPTHLRAPLSGLRLRCTASCVTCEHKIFLLRRCIGSMVLNAVGFARCTTDSLSTSSLDCICRLFTQHGNIMSSGTGVESQNPTESTGVKHLWGGSGVQPHNAAKGAVSALHLCIFKSCPRAVKSMHS
jgi:hypothetical protein